MQSLYEAYAVLDAEMKALEAKKETLRLNILQQMESNGEEAIETPVGKFSVTKLKKWTYPEAVLEIGEKFKVAKAKAESTGEATFVESPSLRLTQIKL